MLSFTVHVLATILNSMKMIFVQLSPHLSGSNELNKYKIKLNLQ